MEIKIVNLNKYIDKIQILRNINITINSEAGINVLIGPNGAGKTSLLRQIAILDQPTSGEIFYDTQSVSRMTDSEKTGIRRRIGFVFQNPLILNGTVYDNLVYPLKVRNIRIDKNKIEEILNKTGLSDKVFQPAKTLSGGEKQRLSIARVIIFEPETLFFDEPTANLDPINVKTIESIISGLAESKKAILFATHNLRQVRQFGNQIFFMNSGEIIQQGTAEEVFTKPVKLDIAEYSFAENIFYGKIVTENEQIYLVTNNLKINVVLQNINGEVVGILRPEDIFVSKSPLESSARNCFYGTIKEIKSMGMVYMLTVEVKGTSFDTVITKQSLMTMNLNTGDEIYLTFKATAVHLLSR